VWSSHSSISATAAKIEEALRASEQHLLHEKQLIDLSREPILVWDLEDASCNGTAAVRSSMASNEWRRSDNRVKAFWGPPCRFVIRAGQSTLRERGNWRGELIQRTRDGRETYGRQQARAGRGRRSWLVFESARDITERKQWEQQQRLLLRELNHRVKNTLAVVQADCSSNSEKRQIE